MDEPEDDIIRQKEFALARAFAILTENFDNVVVLAAAPFPDKRTIKYAKHEGDIYSCIGMADVFTRRWCRTMDES